MYDIIIIGSGPGGTTAAERASQQGKKTLLIEKSDLGGVCLNEGCIPTKTLLHSAKQYIHAAESGQFGVSVSDVSFDLAKAMAWKDQVIDTLRKGVGFNMKRHKVEIVTGTAKITAPNTVEVNGTEYQGTNIIIATGSSTFIPAIPGVKDSSVITSIDALQLKRMPKSMIVIGGGVIGIEFASFFSSFGVDVHVVEMLDEIIPFMDTEIARALRKAMKKVNFVLGAKVASIQKGSVTFSKDGVQQTIDAELVLMAVGRRPDLSKLGLETIGLGLDEKGIKVTDKMETNVPGVYAIGDATGKMLLAHTASRMAEVAVNTICGVKDEMRYRAIPWAVYGIPECAGCGMTESEAVQAGIKIRTATAHMRINGRFLAENGFAPGLCKVIIDTDKGTLIGVHMMGGICSEMIFGVAAMIEEEMTVDKIKKIVFPHPSVSEIIKDTLFSGEPVDFLKNRQYY